MFLKIFQNSQENTCARISFLIKMQAWEQQIYQKRDSGTRPATLVKKRQVFSYEFCEFNFYLNLIIEIKTKWKVSDLSFTPNAFKKRNLREKLCDEISENFQNRIKLIIKESLHQKKHNAPSIVKHLILPMSFLKNRCCVNYSLTNHS